MVGEALNLLQFSDPHLFAERDGELRGVQTFHSLSATVRQALRTHPDTDAILLTGDLAQDESHAAYERLVECLADVSVPVYCIAGNHDNPAAMRDVLTREPFFLTDLLGDHWTVAMLDSHEPGQAAGKLSDPELARLDALLDERREQHALVVLHHHPVASGSAWLDTVMLTNAGQLFGVLRRHPQTRGVAWGHVHQAAQTKRRGLLLLATPSTCSQFRPRSASFALDDKPPGYRWLRLDRDGTIATAVHWVDSARR